MKKVAVCVIILSLTFSLFAAGTKEAAGSGPVSMRFSWWGGSSRHEGTLAAIEAYQAKNPEVSIAGEYSGFDGYYQKMVTQLAGGTAADILQIDAPWLNELASKGDIFVDLSKQDIDLSGFDPKFLADFCTVDGKILGVPTGLNGEVFLFDTTVLKRAGIPLDTVWTWENMVTLGKKVNQSNPNGYFLNIAPDTVVVLFDHYLTQLAGGYIDDDKNVVFTVGQAEQAFKYFKSWLDEKIIPSFEESSLFNEKSEEDPAWINRESAGMRTWVSTLKKLQANRPDEECLIVPYPVLKGATDTGVRVRPSQLISINAKSKHVKEAVAFIQYFFNAPEAIEILGTVRGTPPTAAAREYLKQNDMLDPFVELGTKLSLDILGNPISKWKENSEVVEIISDIVERFGFRMLTPRAAAEALVSELNSKLAELE